MKKLHQMTQQKEDSDHIHAREELLRVGGIWSILHAMNLGQSDEAVQENGCAILADLTFKCSENKKAVIELDGVATLADAMKRFPDNDILQANACIAFQNLAHCTTVRFSEQVIVLILEAMKNHKHDEFIQKAAMWFLRNVVEQSRKSKGRIVKHDGLKTVKAGLKSHQELQELGRSLLKELTS